MKNLYILLFSIIHLFVFNTVTAKQNLNENQNTNLFDMKSASPAFYKSLLEVLSRNLLGKSFITSVSYQSMIFFSDAGFQNPDFQYDLANAGSGSLMNTANEFVFGKYVNQDNFLQSIGYRFLARMIVGQVQYNIIRVGEQHDVRSLHTSLFLPFLILTTSWFLNPKEGQSDAVKSAVQEVYIKGVLNNIDHSLSNYVFAGLNYPWYLTMILSSAYMSGFDYYLLNEKENENKSEKAAGLFGRFLGYALSR